VLESKLRAQKKQLKPGGKAATIHALKATLAASGLGSGSDLALAGLPSLAGLMEPPKRPRSVGAWLRSADVSTKRPASEKQLSHFEQRLKDLGMPAHVLPTETNVRLYNTCRAHVVLLIELESKLKRLEYERNVLQVKKAGGGSAAGGATPSGGGHASKRSRAELGERAAKRSHH
jgi:predicted PhzF superfamily epimerase YddE/YHI9